MVGRTIFLGGMGVIFVKARSQKDWPVVFAKPRGGISLRKNRQGAADHDERNFDECESHGC